MCAGTRNKVGLIPLLFAVYCSSELLCEYTFMCVFVHYGLRYGGASLLEDIMSRAKVGGKKSVANPLWIFTTKPSYVLHALKTCV